MANEVAASLAQVIEAMDEGLPGHWRVSEIRREWRWYSTTRADFAKYTTYHIGARLAAMGAEIPAEGTGHDFEAAFEDLRRRISAIRRGFDDNAE